MLEQIYTGRFFQDNIADNQVDLLGPYQGQGLFVSGGSPIQLTEESS